MLDIRKVEKDGYDIGKEERLPKYIWNSEVLLRWLCIAWQPLLCSC